MHRAGMRREAMDCYIRVLRDDPENADALYFVAVLSIQEGQIEEGVKLIHRALGFDARQARLHNLLGQALHRLSRHDEALVAFDRAIEINPDYADAHGNRALLLSEMGRSGEALLGFDRALKLRPDSADDWCNRGTALHDLGRLAEALESYDQALLRDPRLAGAHANRADILRDLGQLDAAMGHPDSKALDDAEAAYTSAIRIDPQFVGARVGRARLRLLRGQWETGWPDYEYRLRAPAPGFKSLSEPQWRGGELPSGAQLVLVTEQDTGDIICFARFAALLAARGLDVAILTRPALKPLLSTLKGVAIVTSPDEIKKDRPIRWLPLLSIAGVLDVRPESVPADVPYLAADTERAKRIAAQLGTTGFKIGINWAAGEANERHDRRRDIPVTKFAGFAEIPGLRLISLQRGPAAAETAQLPFKVETLELDGDTRAGAYLDAAAAIANLDLVVTCDCEMAHLAGALGRPVFTALPVISHWRWMLGRNDTPWYPTMRLFRQVTPQVWSEPFVRMTSEVKSQANQSRRLG